MHGAALRLGALVLATIAALALFDALLFWTPLYRGLLAPDSSAGAALATIRALRAGSLDRHRDVLVLGDSRIFRGFDPQAAEAAAPGLRFHNAGVAGTTPRCWPYLARSADPATNDIAALVVPVDAYDDTSLSIGGLDADEHQFDLHFLAVTSSLADVPELALSYPNPLRKAGAAASLLLRAPLYADDVQEFLADPFGRFHAIRAEGSVDPTRTAHADADSLFGLRRDEATHSVSGLPSRLDTGERRAVAAAVLAAPVREPRYAAYRIRWLGELVARYRKAGVPVIFVRIPARPLPLAGEARDAPGPSTAIGWIVARNRARWLPAARYVALERPEFFSDHDHLDAAGAREFSALLGRDVAREMLLAGRSDASAAIDTNLPDTNLSSTPRVTVAELFAGPIALGSLEFAVFVLLTLAVTLAVPARAGRIIVLLASYYFYARWNGLYAVVLFALTVSDYAIALWLERLRPAARSRRVALALGIAANLAFLGFFKYLDFLGATLGLISAREPLWVLHLAVPIGISFHTFQSISYLVDVSRGTVPARKNFFDYALYLAFFPQLLAGPIVRAATFFGELDAWRRPGIERFTRGITEIVRGVFAKFVLADNLAPFADAYFGNVPAHPGALSAWSGTLAFALQIYFDFSGYSNIAIGTARLFGFDFPQNFNRPYLASGARDFWRRWHMTLSSWLRDYVYVPLGGNRRGYSRTIVNLMLTMLLGGLWHGAGWTFVAWGAYHGAWLSIERLVAGRARSRLEPHGARRIVATLGAVAVVTLGWVLFRAASFSDAWDTGRSLLFLRAGTDLSPIALSGWVPIAAAVAFAREIAEECGLRLPTPLDLRGARALLAVPVVAAVLLGAQLLWAPAEQTFVYFKF